MNTSFFLTSKRFWVNFIGIALGVIGVITKTYPLNPEIVGIVIGVLNLILSTISPQPIGWVKN